ncbi:MAG: type II toxin-antitoxin system RelE/ParE family toxin [Deltaproteobacteria bacterium]|nr:type II toxin-antitoxin system RelE/ParE family toxin [Deltaproteobacteria bacterium]
MKFQIVLRPEAESDLKEAFRWYEERRKGLGSEFVLSVEASIGSVQRNPKIYPAVYKKVHRALIQRFPFGLFYLVEKEEVVVLAVFHVRREPRNWKTRTTV